MPARHAIIHRLAKRAAAPLLDVAGKPLVLRQVQWLRAARCELVVVELPLGAPGDEVARVLTDAPLGLALSIVRTEQPGDVGAVAAAGGIPKGVSYVAVPADVLGEGDLAALFVRQGQGDVVAQLRTSAAHLSLPPQVRLHRGTGAAPETCEAPSWGARIRGATDAYRASARALDRAFAGQKPTMWPVSFHASEVAPGVWVARGARVAPDAVLTAPVLIGARAIVCKGARLGPRVIVEDDAVIGAGVQLARSLVTKETVVAEDQCFEDVILSPGEAIDARNGASRVVAPQALGAVREWRSRSRRRGLLAALCVVLALGAASARTSLRTAIATKAVHP